MAVKFLEPGTDATFGTEFWPTTGWGSGGSSSSTQVCPGHQRSLKIAPAGTLSGIRSPSGVLGDAGRRISCYLYIETMPTADEDIICIDQQTSTTGPGIDIEQSTKKLKFWKGDGYTAERGSTVLATGRWYHVEVSYVITSTSNYTFKVWVDGNLELTITGASGTLTTTTRDTLALRMTTGVWYLSDIYVDDGATLDEPGTIFVTAKRPATDVTMQFDTIIGTDPGVGSRYQLLRDRPLDTARGVQQAGSSSAGANFNIEAANVGDADISRSLVLGHMGWIWAKKGSGTGTNEAMYYDSNIFGIALTTTAKLFTNLITGTAYPNATSYQIGMRSTGGGADSFLYECGIVIACIPALFQRPRSVMQAVSRAAVR